MNVTHHKQHGLVNISFKTVPVLSKPLEGSVRVPVASSQLLLFDFHQVVYVTELFLQT